MPKATYDCIATTTLGSSQATITFSSISSNFTDLVLIVNAASSSSFDWLVVRFNNDTGTNYSSSMIQGDGSTISSTRFTSTSKAAIGLVVSGADGWNIYKLQIQNYSNTTTNKVLISNGGNAGTRAQTAAMCWKNTAAINRVDVFIDGGDTFASGSTFTLYGIKAE